jgi:hypothetical protein
LIPQELTLTIRAFEGELLVTVGTEIVLVPRETTLDELLVILVDQMGSTDGKRQ